jgi:transporter family-2 protein
MVIQSSLNKSIAESKGLSTACVINGFMVVLFSFLVFIVSYFYPDYFLDIIVFNKSNKLLFKWWYIVPGLLGFLGIFILPLGVMKIGALPVFLGVIAGQVCLSILYDYYFQKMPFDTIRVAGAILTFTGAFLVSWKR